MWLISIKSPVGAWKGCCCVNIKPVIEVYNKTASNYTVCFTKTRIGKKKRWRWIYAYYKALWNSGYRSPSVSEIRRQSHWCACNKSLRLVRCSPRRNRRSRSNRQQYTPGGDSRRTVLLHPKHGTWSWLQRCCFRNLESMEAYEGHEKPKKKSLRWIIHLLHI